MRFLIRQWPDGLVVFDRQFGDTHALNQLTGQVFQLLQVDLRVGSDSIFSQLQAEFSELTPNELKSQIAQSLDQLAICGLLEHA